MTVIHQPVESFTDKEVNPRTAKRPLKTNGRLATNGRFANLELTS